MKQVNPEINHQLMQDYENLPPITTGDDWEQKLFSRIAASRSNYVKNNELLKFTMFLIVFVSLNIILFFSDAESNSQQDEARITLLNNISDQLLINSTSLK